MLGLFRKANKVTAPYDRLVLRSSLVKHEGFERRIYKDSLGNWSAGVGRNLSSVGLSNAEVYYLLENDIDTAEKALDASPCTWWRNLSDARQRAMVELTFNMGWGDGSHGLSSFHEFLSLMASSAFEKAVSALNDSQWAREVQPTRVADITALIRNG